MLTEEQIKDYQKRYKKHYGRGISRKKAKEQGTRLIMLFKTIADYLSKKKNTT